MLLIVEIIFIVTGIWAIATAKLPAFLFGGGQYKAEGAGVRGVGLLLLTPLPLTFILTIILYVIFGERATTYGAILEFFIVIGVAAGAAIAFRRIRQPIGVLNNNGQWVVDEKTQIEALIAKKAQGALIYSLLGILGFTALIVCPLAFIYATQALRLIEKHKLGEVHRRTAYAARAIASVIFIIYAGLVSCFLIAVFTASVR